MLFIYNKDNKGPNIDPWETAQLIVPAYIQKHNLGWNKKDDETISFLYLKSQCASFCFIKFYVLRCQKPFEFWLKSVVSRNCPLLLTFRMYIGVNLATMIYKWCFECSNSYCSFSIGDWHGKLSKLLKNKHLLTIFLTVCLPFGIQNLDW